MKTATFIFLLVCGVLAGFSQTGNQFDEEKEKIAILATLTAETEYFFKRDYEGVKKYFVHSDYAFHAWNNADGTFAATVGWPAIDEKYRNYIRQNPVPAGSSSHPKVERHNMVWKFYNSDVAFLIWDQYNSDQSSKMYNHSKETRLMEKQNGIWKIVNMTALWDYKNVITADSLKIMLKK